MNNRLRKPKENRNEEKTESRQNLDDKSLPISLSRPQVIYII